MRAGLPSASWRESPTAAICCFCLAFSLTVLHVQSQDCSIIITQQPQSMLVLENCSARFEVGVTGAMPVFFQWFRDGAFIAGATNSSYTVEFAHQADNGSLFRAVVTNSSCAMTSETAVLSVSLDVVPPQLSRAIGGPTLKTVAVYFVGSCGLVGGVDPVSATDVYNYSLSGGLSVSNAVVAAGGTNIILTTSPQTAGAEYTLYVENVTDLSGNVIPIGSHVTFRAWTPTVAIYATDSHASEALSGTGTFTVTRTGSTNFPVAVFYYLSGTGSNSVDYEQLGSSVQIPAGAFAASVAVKPIDDVLVEGEETVVAQITGSPLDCATCGYNIGVPSNAVVVIADNDGPAETNRPPAVQIAAPANGTVFPAAADIWIAAQAFDFDGFVATVEFFEGTHSLGITTNNPLIVGPMNPFMITWSNVPAGNYELTARATDDKGAMAVSPLIHVLVVETNIVPQAEVNIYAIDDTGREIPVVPPWLGMVQESDPIVLIVTRTGPTNSPLTVFYSVGGTASNGVDYFYGGAGFYQPLPGEVVIPAGASSANIDIWVIDDFEVEGTETVELTLQPLACIQIFPPPPDCYVVGPSNQTVAKILDNDLTLAPIVTIVATDPNASESGPNTGRFTVSRTGDTSNSLPVFYTIGGTAQSGIDYLTFSNFEPFFNAFGLTNVVIPAGANSTDITVTPIDDHLAESSETVVLQLQPQPWAPYLIGAPSNAVVTIADNEVGGTNHPPFVQLNAPRNGDVFIAPATIALMAYAQDAEDGYHLQVEFFEGTNILGFGTFEATTCPDPYCPFYALTWSNVPPGEYVLRAKATDSAGASSVSAAAHITVFGGVNVYATDPDASEISSARNMDPPSDAAIFTVRRFGETNMGIVVYYEVSGTASNGVDYLGLPGEVTIPAGASSAQIVVRPVDDNLVEGTETVVLTLLPTCPQCLFVNPPCLPPQGTNCYPIGPDNKAVAYIHDDDAESNLPPVVRMVRPGDGEMFQARSDIQLVAFAQDAEDSYFVQVEFFEGTRSLGLGTFNPTRCATDCPNYVLTWSNVPAGEYVVRAKATDSQGAMSFSHSVRISVTGTNVPPETNAPVVTIVASDAIAVEGPFCRSNWWWTSSWNGSDWTIIPGSRDPNSLAWRTNHCSDTNTATFMVRHSGPTNAELVVYYAIGGTASNGVDYVALPGRATIPAGHRSARITVISIEDLVPERIETVLLGLQPPQVPGNGTTTYVVGSPSRAAALILDNDQPRPSCMRLSDGMFHVCRPATNGHSFTLRGSADLVNWTVLCTNTVTDGAVHYVDPDAPNFNTRFYQVTPELFYAPEE